MTSVELISEWTGVDMADVRVLVAALGHEGDELPKDIAGAVMGQLQPSGGERSVPGVYAEPHMEPWWDLIPSPQVQSSDVDRLGDFCRGCPLPS